MPKSRGGQGGSSKKPSLSHTIDEESNVVFGDPNATKKAEKGGASVDSSKDGVNGQAIGDDATKRPDTRKLIGGASWTGKLPVNMLSEHCQKQKWARPVYKTVVTFNWSAARVYDAEPARRLRRLKAFRQWSF